MWSSVLNELLYNAESRRQNHNIFHELNFERLPKNVWVDNIDNTPYVDNVSIAFYRQHYYRVDNISDYDNAIIAVYRQTHYRSVQCYVCVVYMRYRWCCKTEEKSNDFSLLHWRWLFINYSIYSKTLIYEGHSRNVIHLVYE